MNDSERRKMVGEKVARLRKRARLSQAKMGQPFGMGQSMISQIEKGQRPIPYEHLAGLAELLGVDEAELSVDSIAPDVRGHGAGRLVSSVEDIEAWRSTLLMDPALEENTKLILALLAAPVFLSRATWMAVTTVEQFIFITGRSRELVEGHWPSAMRSPYVEQVGEAQWNLRLRFPS